MSTRWWSPLLMVALLVSLVLHLTAATSDLLLAWWENDSLQADDTIRATKRKLNSQTLDSSLGGRHALAGVKPADTLEVTFGLRSSHPAHMAPSAAQAARAKPPKPAPKPEAKPADAPALAQVEAKTPAPQLPTVDAAPTPPPAEPLVAAAATPAAVPPVPDSKEPLRPGNSPQAPLSQRPVLNDPFPKAATINYLLNGFAPIEAKWQVEANRYELSLNIGMLGKARSGGSIDEHGLKPVQYQQFKVNDPNPRYQVDFDWAGKTVLVGEPGKQKSEVLHDGAVDVFAAGYQFALLGDKLPSFDIQVLTGRASYTVNFALKGEAELTLSDVKVPTLVLGGSQGKRSFDYYLAPQWHNLPVRIRYNDGDKSYDLIATQMLIDDKVVLARRSRRAVEK